MASIEYVAKCDHHGPRLVMVVPGSGGLVYAGKAGVVPPVGSHVLDLADNARDLPVSGAIRLWRVTRINWPDMSTPKLEREHWQAIANETRQWPTYVACMAGHGRTGTALAILGCLWGVIPETVVVEKDDGDGLPSGERTIPVDPVAWIRANVDPEMVETDQQCRYVAKMTGRVVEAHGTKGGKDWLTGPISTTGEKLAQPWAGYSDVGAKPARSTNRHDHKPSIWERGRKMAGAGDATPGDMCLQCRGLGGNHFPGCMLAGVNNPDRQR